MARLEFFMAWKIFLVMFMSSYLSAENHVEKKAQQLLKLVKKFILKMYVTYLQGAPFSCF